MNGDLLNRLLSGDLPPAKWAEVANGLTPSMLLSIDNQLSDMAQRAAFAQGYFAARAGICSHSTGVKRANATLSKVRRALGFSYPNSAEVLF